MVVCVIGGGLILKHSSLICLQSIRSKSQDHTETLLQIVLAAAQPLALGKANIALTLALEKQRFDSQASLVSKKLPTHLFESTVKNLCGLSISVYDSRLLFIHQTAREFLIILNRNTSGKGDSTSQRHMARCHKSAWNTYRISMCGRSDPKIEGRIPTGEISMLKEVDVAMLYRLPLLGIIKTILSPQSFYIPRVLARFFM